MNRNLHTLCFWTILVIAVHVSYGQQPPNYFENLLSSSFGTYHSILTQFQKIYNIPNTKSKKGIRTRYELSKEREQMDYDKSDKYSVFNGITEYMTDSNSKKKTMNKHKHHRKIFNERNEEITKQTTHKNKKISIKQSKYIVNGYNSRRQLKSETNHISCNNTHNLYNNYPSNYEFLFGKLPGCYENSAHVLNETITVNTNNVNGNGYVPLLYSPNCQYALVLAKNGELQMIAFQMALPLWNSGVPSSESSYFHATFRGDIDGDLRVYDNNNNTVYALSLNDESDFNPGGFEKSAPYRIVISNELFVNSIPTSGIFTIYDFDNHLIYSTINYDPPTDALTVYRTTEYNISLLNNNDGSVLYSIPMLVILWMPASKSNFYLEFVPIINTNDETNDVLKAYIDMIQVTEFVFDVNVYKLSTDDYGDEYVMFADTLPMVYTMNNGDAVELNIKESHTFLCISNETRYFNVEIVPKMNNVIVSNNVTLSVLSMNGSDLYDDLKHNYTIALDPWNPCLTGRPILATKPHRRCVVRSDYDSAKKEYANVISTNNDNGYYDNIAMKAAFPYKQCVNKIVKGNITTNQTSVLIENGITMNLTFSEDFSISECEEYLISENDENNVTRLVVNPYFNSTQCTALTILCGGFYEVCYDYTLQICTCYCPRDTQGNNCESQRDYKCKLNILTANTTECELMTQKELNEHGRSDYDVTLDGDKPCFFVSDHKEDVDSNITSVIRLDCTFNKQGIDIHSQVWETLIGYDIFYDNKTFDYCLGNETSPFALMDNPPNSQLRIKIFDLSKVFNDDEVSLFSLDLDHYSGNKDVTHSRFMFNLSSKYKIGGRIYMEYHLKQEDLRISAERRFYDIDHWKMPTKEPALYTTLQIWFICLMVFGPLVCFIWVILKCNKWCKSLEHEKNE